MLYVPRSPGTHIVGSCVMDRISFYRDPRTGTQYIGNWASRVCSLDDRLLRGYWTSSATWHVPKRQRVWVEDLGFKVRV